MEIKVNEIETKKESFDNSAVLAEFLEDYAEVLDAIGTKPTEGEKIVAAIAVAVAEFKYWKMHDGGYVE